MRRLLLTMIAPRWSAWRAPSAYRETASSDFPAPILRRELTGRDELIVAPKSSRCIEEGHMVVAARPPQAPTDEVGAGGCGRSLSGGARAVASRSIRRALRRDGSGLARRCMLLIPVR